MEISKRDLDLQKEFPEILKKLGGDPSKTCMSVMHGGIAIGDGWIPSLRTLFKYCQFQHDTNGYPQLVAEQIKEKFGTLRFYYDFEDCSIEKHKGRSDRNSETLEGAIDFAEMLTQSICEECGQPGKIRKDRWIRVRCDKCETKQKNKMKWIKFKRSFTRFFKFKSKI